MKKTAILGGLGIEGKALLKYLKKAQPELKPVVLDVKTDPDYLSRLEEFDLVYRTPGVLYSLPEIKRAIRKGVEFSSLINLFFEKAQGTIIGVTGTKGKGTTAQLLYEILKKAGRDVYIGGNIGNSPLEFVDKLTDKSITILELSNLQLWDIKHSPHIAVVLGIFPEHLDWHKNLREYVASKTGITKYQKVGDFVFYTAGDKNAQKVADKSKGQKIAIEAESFTAKPGVLGYHNFKNAAMAAAVCSHLGVRPDIALETIRKFKGLPHRLQKVREIGDVDYYNDSASTAPETAVAAVEAFPKRSIILIAGGRDKNSDYSILEKGIRNREVKLAILFGASKEKIKDSLKPSIKTQMAKDLAKAVEIAHEKAEPGDVVLFSPGATSLDMFKNYKDRGEQFEKIVKKLKG